MHTPSTDAQVLSIPLLSSIGLPANILPLRLSMGVAITDDVVDVEFDGDVLDDDDDSDDEVFSLYVSCKA